jgi:hypothetical protein
MKNILLICFAALLIAAALGCQRPSGELQLRPGDVVFQDLDTPQSQAVKLATNSEFSHCGIVFYQDDNLFVYEALQPVRVTPLVEWINQGVDSFYVAMRLYGYDTLLTEEALGNMKQVAESYLGLPYDIYFDWSDSQMYCSEYVWKIYDQGIGVQIADLHKFADYDLSHPEVQQILQQRWGDSLPMDDPVVAPEDLYESQRFFVAYPPEVN